MFYFQHRVVLEKYRFKFLGIFHKKFFYTLSLFIADSQKIFPISKKQYLEEKLYEF